MANEGGMTKQDLVDALKEVGFKPGSGGNSSANQGGAGSTGTGFKQADEAASSVGKKLKDELGSAATSAAKGFGDLKDAADKNINTWRDLSDKGANFGNNIVGMNVAASGSRVSLSEFSDTIANNSKAFIGLGGNVGHGGQKFAQLTDEMYTNMAPVTDQLRQQGVSNKELNDILALQIGFQRGSFKDDKEGHAESIKAATDLANEMNSIAQLQGISRKEMEEKLKKESVNAQVEAKMRLIGATEGPEAEKKARLAYAENFARAEAQGQGQRFREIFATGHEVTKEAAAQGAMTNQQGAAIAEMAKASAKGNMAEADKAHKMSLEGQQKNAKDITTLQLATYGGVAGLGGKVAESIVTSTQSAYDAEKKIRQEAAFKNATDAEITAERIKRAEAAKLGKDEKGADQAGNATTKAAVNIEQRMNDAGAAVAKNLVNPLNEKAGPAINKFADTALGAQQKLSNGKVVTTPQANDMAVKQGYEGTGSTAGAKPTGLVNQALNTAGTVGKAGESVAEGVGSVVGFFKDATSSKPPQKADGGIVPGTDKGTTVTVGEKGKPEAIVPLDQLKTAGGANPVGGMTSNEQLKAKAEEAIRIIKEHGEGSFSTQIRITESGSLRLREQFDEHNEKMQSLGQASSEERIAELIAQAEKIKAADQKTSEDRVKNVVETVKVEANAGEVAKSKAKAMAEAYGGRSEGGVETVKPPPSINDMMGDMMDKISGGIDVKSIAKDIKTSSTDPKVQAEIEKSEKDKKYIAENKAKAEKEKQHNQASVQKVEHKATLDDVVAALMKLNSTMHQVADHSEGIKRATKNMSGNSLTRG